MRSTLDGAVDALTKLDRMYPPEPGENRPDAVTLTERLLAFASSPAAGIADAERLLGGLMDGAPEVAVAAINLVRDLHAAMPDSIMMNASSREQQSRILMSLSDRLVDAEEAAYGE